MQSLINNELYYHNINKIDDNNTLVISNKESISRLDQYCQRFIEESSLKYIQVFIP